VIGVVVVVLVTLAAVLVNPEGITSGVASDAPVDGMTVSGSNSSDAGGGNGGTDGDGTSTVPPTGHTTTVQVAVEGMSFTPSTIEVPAGDRLVIELTNTGDQRHDLVLEDGTAIDVLAPGAAGTLDAGVLTGDVEGWCSLPGHRQMGMTLTILATGTDEGAGTDHGAEAHGGNGTDSGTATGTTSPSAAELAQAAEDTDAHPAELPALTDETDHEYTFHVTEQTEQVTADLSRTVWTYNGTTPGPVLHGRVGDTFTITLVNDGTMGHSIDFHAGELAPDEPMRTIEPGKSLTYTFTAERAGIWMYHCSTMPMSQHIASGMFGAVVIEPEGLPEVDRSYVLIQSELYLGAEGEAADADAIVSREPDALAFNGRAFQYDAHPLQAQAGERVRIWVLDAGPNEDLAFHVVGTQFDTVWTEGAYSVYHGESRDGVTDGSTGAQVLPLQPAQGGFVEFEPTEAGHYSIVNHRMSSAEKGAHGILEVGAGE
jgi:nitrite reductase (NO-forming)